MTCKFDARGRRFECTDRVNSVTKWRFDQNSNLLSLEDGENQLTEYEYDVRNLLVKTTWPDHVVGQNPGDANYGITEAAYDAASRTVRSTDQLGDTRTNNFDLANRLTSRDYRLRLNSPAGVIADSDSFEYDDVRRMTKATSGRYTNVVDLAYDNASRLTSEALTIAGQTYTVGSDYDDANRRTKLTYPDGTVVNRDYTDRNQLLTVKYTNTAVGGTLNNFTVDTRAYDDGMRLQTITSGNGIVTTKNYRSDNLTSSITRAGLSGADFTYDYDANKNKLKETINPPMAGYGFNSVANAQYDDEDRLTGWTRDDNNKTQTWNLSLVGDWDTFTEAGTTPFSETRTHGATHELTNITGGLIPGALTHDAKGNITANSNTQGYTWDFDNQLSQAVVPAGAPGTTGTHEYEYDALGRRVAKTVDALGTPATMVYVCNGQQVIAEYTSGIAAGTALRKYLYASYIDEPCLLVDRTAQGSSGAGIEEIFYYHQNNLYSVAALSDALGAVFERYAYDAYGNLAILDALGTTLRAASLISNPYSYTGRRFDEETENYFYRARYYDAKLGRFINRDPIEYGGGYNLFSYVRNNPQGRVDPSGLVDPDLKFGVKVNGNTYRPDSIPSMIENATGAQTRAQIQQSANQVYAPYVSRRGVGRSLGTLIQEEYLSRAAGGAMVIPQVVARAVNEVHFDDDGQVATHTSFERSEWYVAYALDSGQAKDDGKWYTIRVKNWTNSYDLVDVVPMTKGDATFWISTPWTLDARGSYDIRITCPPSGGGNFFTGAVRNRRINWRLTDRIDANSAIQYDWRQNSIGQGILETTVGDLVGDKALGASFYLAVFFNDISVPQKNVNWIRPR